MKERKLDDFEVKNEDDLSYLLGKLSEEGLLKERFDSKELDLVYSLTKEGKKVFEYDIYECPEELKGQLKIGDYF